MDKLGEPEPEIKKTYTSMDCYNAATLIQCIYRGSIQRKRKMKEMIMNGKNVDVDLILFSHIDSYNINLGQYLQENFVLISTMIKKGYFKLYSIKKIKYQGYVNYLSVTLHHYIDSFNISVLCYFINNIGKCSMWDNEECNRTLSISYIKNIRKGCEYFCWTGSVISEELHYYYDRYFNNIVGKLLNKIILEILEYYKYKHNLTALQFNFLRYSDVSDYGKLKNETFKLLKFKNIITQVLLNMYKDDDSVIDDPLSFLIKYIKEDNNIIKGCFDEYIKNLLVD